MTNQLYNVLGLSLGIARYEEEEDVSIVLQLWSLPLNERLNGITKNLIRGYRGVIVVVRPDELDQLPQLLNAFSVDQNPNLVVAVVGDVQGIESELLRRIPYNEDCLEVHTTGTGNDVVNILSSRLKKKVESDNEKIAIVFLDDEQCPIFEPQVGQPIRPSCTDEEVDEIRSILISQDIRVIEDSCMVEIQEGIAWVSLRTGAVRLEPALCNYCANDCRRQTSICIIAVDSGWSTQEIGQRALLTTAKVLALTDRKLPSHVENQIQRASSCSRFELSPDLLEDEIPTELFLLQPKSAHLRKTLLEVASERVKEGRLPEPAYNMLKRRLTSLQKSVNT
ncbi:MAG: hypothetical protein RTV72_09515 [Candidatus Thorarchaeota archaeon]